MPEDAKRSLIEVTPGRNLRTLYIIYLLIIVWLGILPWLIPLAFLSPPLFTLGITLPLLMIIVYIIWWIGAYYRTIRYRFTSFEISWDRGVWFHRSGKVPYQGITSIDIIQGPISRFLGISVLLIQASDYASGTASAVKLKIHGIPEPEMLREFIRMQMQKRQSNAPCSTKTRSVD
jgi:membrane protein YdbS with pleckstrin-like domain